MIAVSEQFNELFDQWAESYDNTVHGGDVEYKEVFRNYEEILQTIADRSHGSVLEFGVGTGNLTQRVIDAGLEVVGIEPSENMREIAQQKLPGVTITKGNFLVFPFTDQKVDTIISSYAFHHLTDEEKEQAIAIYANILNEGGKIVFGDTFFENKDAHQEAIQKAKNQQYNRLAEDLSTEYYTTIPKMAEILEKYHFTASFEKLNDFVWIMEAKRTN